MEKMEFIINIAAPREKVWTTLWEDASYRGWTSVFAPGSRAETDWKIGSKVLFVDDKNSGMVSFIEQSIPNEYMSFKHMGTVKDGIEDLESESIKAWAGALENYTLKPTNEGTELTVNMLFAGLSQPMLDYFQGTWPKALALLKDLAEK